MFQRDWNESGSDSDNLQMHLVVVVGKDEKDEHCEAVHHWKGMDH